MDILLGSSQNWTISRGQFFAVKGLFLRSRYRMGGGIFFGVAKNSNIFWGVLEIPDIFWGCTVDAGSEPTYKEK